MESILEALTSYEKMMNVFFNMFLPHMKDPELKKSTEERYYDKKKPKNVDIVFERLLFLSDIFELGCFSRLFDAEANYTTGTSPVIQNYDFYAIVRAMDLLTYRIFHYVRENHNEEYSNPHLQLLCKIVKSDDPIPLIEEIIPDSFQLFHTINPSILNMEDEELTSPIDAERVVKMKIKNTKNMMFSCNSLMNRDFIAKEYDFPRNSGLRNEILNRFDNNKEYTEIKESSAQELDLDGDKVGVYSQYLGERDGQKYYRRLKDYDSRDNARSYYFLGANMYINNMENKRLTLLRSTSSVVKRPMMDQSMIGQIKHRFRRTDKLGQAVYDTVLPKIKSDEQILRLISSCIILENNKAIIANKKILDRPKTYNCIKHI